MELTEDRASNAELFKQIKAEQDKVAKIETIRVLAEQFAELVKKELAALEEMDGEANEYKLNLSIYSGELDSINIIRDENGEFQCVLNRYNYGEGWRDAGLFEGKYEV